ncbi:MAG: UDP-N-acetylmuramate--L-alanine ligase [Solirubrobacterales bacterium]
MSFTGRRLHLIGIGGAGMSGLALAAHELGALVTGSDRAQSSYTDRLVAAGIDVSIGHDADNVPDGADVVVSTAIGEDNPELAAARAAGSAVLHRSDLLETLVEIKPTCIAVAGTHGKTTTTAMIAHVLMELGRDPSFFVGGEVTVGNELTNAHVGDGEVVVVEADESDGSFLKLHPTVAVVTNVELDHHATWAGGLDELFGAFATFTSPAQSTVLWRGQPRLWSELSNDNAIGFGIDETNADVDGDVIATKVETPEDPTKGSRFTLGGTVVELGVRGEHNVLNALAALAALQSVGISTSDAASKLATFKGVARRFEFLGRSENGALVYDDYAHHPTEVRAALTTARATAGSGRVVAVFQPHLYSRTTSLSREFGKSLALADVAVVSDIYAAREKATAFPGVTGWLVATDAADAMPGREVYWSPSLEDVRNTLDRLLRPDDLCITIGAGDIFTVGHGMVR